MKLLTLSLRDWRQFEACDLEFPDGVIGVRGPNGSGKTTIAEAVGWALFGKARPGAKVAELKRQGSSGPSFVELTFRLGPTVYRVKRVVNGAATFWIGDAEEPESTQTTATNKAIKRELGITWESFHRTVFARQKDVAALDPSATKQARTKHVERLLGLHRYRDAADEAKRQARTLKSELKVLSGEAPDLAGLRAELASAEAAAAKGDPAVAAAAENRAGTREACTAAETARYAENERVQRHRALLARRAERQDDLGERRASRDELVARDEARSAELLELAELQVDLPDLDALLLCETHWKAFAECQAEVDALAAESDVDAQAVAERRERLTVIDGELERLGAASLPDADGLAARVTAMERAEGLPTVLEAADEMERKQASRDAAREELAAVRAEIASGEKHLAALDEGGADAACPTCLRPYGDGVESIRARHESRLVELQSRREEHTATVALRDDEHATAVDILHRAQTAAGELAATAGPDELAAATAALQAAREAAQAHAAKVSTLTGERSTLAPLVQADIDAEQELAIARAVRAEKLGRLRTAADRLGVEEFDRELAAAAASAAAAARIRHDRIGTLSATVAASEGVPAQLVKAQERVAELEAEISQLTASLASAPEPGRLDALEAALVAAREEDEAAQDALTEARLAAQSSDQTVQELRVRVAEAEEIEAKIGERTLACREHEVAAELLEAFRKAQSERAWPNLEQGAGTLLSDTTDGRYADIRLSDDYRLEITDRGERFGLERYSGGEQDLANLCLRLAIAEWVARERDTELGFVILDEVFGSQDEDRRQRLLEALRALGVRFDQLLVITHVAEIADLCDHQLVVTPSDEIGISTAEIISG